MRDYNEFNHGKRYKSEERINRNKAHRPNAQLHTVTYVSETEEEDLHSDDDKAGGGHRPKKLKIMTLAHLSSILNKKLFSDDFDKNSNADVHSQ
jgi:hypothetical protein